jgi:hypothetical protein
MLAARVAEVNLRAEFEMRREFTIFPIRLWVKLSDAALKAAALH